ncbi:MAG: chromate resistance protein ChrB domain-containing protein [Ekhidna sp.]
MKWITREKPKIDRIASPWLIKRFVDQQAEFYYVPFDHVKSEAKKLDAIPFDIPGVEYTHFEDKCTFDYIISKHKLTDPALIKIAKIVRAADTDRHEIAEEAPGLWAISAGLAFNISDDHELLSFGMILYDGLYSWAKKLQQVKHTKNSSESLLQDIYQKFMRHEKKSAKSPIWVKELEEMIQDQIDTEFTLTLKEIAKMLQVHPAYLSREFSKHFNDLNFGEYIRKLRIEKAINLLESNNHSLAEIAYLTGFSDQSYFTRVFKKETGFQPSVYRKKFLEN